MFSSSRIKSFLTFLLLNGTLLIISPTLFATYGSFIYGAGISDSGLAGSSLALPEDAFSGAYNPAAMTKIDSQVNLDVHVASPIRGYSASGSGSVSNGEHDSRENYFIIPDFGYTHKYNKSNAFGVLVYDNSRFTTDYSSGANVYGSGAAGIDSTLLFVNTFYAHQFSRYLSAGLGLIIAGQTFSANGIGAFAAYSKDSSTKNLTNEGTDYAIGATPQASIQIYLPYHFSLAAAYRPKIYMTKMGLYKNFIAKGGELDVPATGSIGLAWKLDSRMAITTEVQRIWFHDVPALGNDVGRLLNIGINPEYRLGASDGAGFGWNNMTIYAIGYALHTRNHWTWRLGYSYADQPINKADVVFNILAPGVIKHHFTAGFSKGFDAHNVISGYVMYAPSHTLRGYNVLAPTQKINLTMHQFQIGIGWRYLL